MTDVSPNSDQAARLRAIDPEGSYIVQAPAGSGKTSLLTQRYLKLLSGVSCPEEIVAITFTRKAAAEMRGRILAALKSATGAPPTGDEFAMQTFELARGALERDRSEGWELLANPARLRVQTIDSLCARLTRQMPILSRFGALPAIADDATPIYLEAARNTLALMEGASPFGDDIALLVRHLDNRMDRLVDLIVAMLARRDQWIAYLADPDEPHLERERLEEALRRLTTDLLRHTCDLVPEDRRDAIAELARFAGSHLPADSESSIAACAELDALPGVEGGALAAWLGIAEMLLTARDGAWRRAVDARIGFPPASAARGAEERGLFTEMKARMGDLLASLEERETLREALNLLRLLPPARYSDAEWRTLRALITLLRVAAANLELEFGSEGQVDFQALVAGANRALGEPDAPTDLALSLDYRIRHLLVDEFQDTSRTQFALLTRLTAGWHPGDGHTLFLVGDPMQSIYRFREAEVGLFITARTRGVGDLPLTPLTLRANFRSQGALIEWVNERFPAVLATEDDLSAGAIRFVSSEVRNGALPGKPVSIHPFLGRDDAGEAQQILRIVEEARREHPSGTTAILARNRAHLAETIALLKRERVPFQAVEIEQLARRPAVLDLLSLTRALLDLGDRVAWLALLRAPWCGLDLADLHELAAYDHESTLRDLLRDPGVVARLTREGQARIARIVPPLELALAARERRDLRAYVEGTWYALGGPACANTHAELADCEVYFQLLERLGTDAEPTTTRELGEQVEALYALPDPDADGTLQLMTIHKAKGLEFDTVILPGLGRGQRGEETRLLHWSERNREDGGADLLLAPIHATGDERNPVATYLRTLDRARDLHEASRLVYVAMTRARQRVHLLGHVNITDSKGELRVAAPAGNSLLARLWPAVGDAFHAALDQAPGRPASGQQPPGDYRRKRLSLAWRLPEPPSPAERRSHEIGATAAQTVEFDWAGETARHIGTVAHRLLQQVARTGVERFDAAAMGRYERLAPGMLRGLGVPRARLADASAAVAGALSAAATGERGRWILSSDHRDAQSELALTAVRDGVVERMVIDRTFIDDEGVRWIIDYKMGRHTGAGVAEFLDREQERYRAQLERYAAAFSKVGAEPVRLALYFPLAEGWREWAYRPAAG